MNIDTKRRILTAAGAVLGIALGAIVTAQHLGNRPTWFSDDINNAPAKAVPGIPSMSERRIMVNRNGAVLWVRLESSKRCGRSDLDYINDDLTRLKQGHLLLTVEPLFGAGGVEPVFKRGIALREIVRGSDSNIVFPYDKQYQHYGLYICTDSEGKGSCQGKPLADFLTEPPAVGSPDLTYFFSYLLLHGDTVRILDNSIFPTEEQQLDGYLRSIEELGDAEVQSIVQTVRAMSKHSKMRKMSIDANEARIKVVIPRRSNARECKDFYVIRGERGTGRVLVGRPGEAFQDISGKKEGEAPTHPLDLVDMPPPGAEQKPKSHDIADQLPETVIQ